MIAIIGAMPQEVDALNTLLDDVKQHENHYLATFEGSDIVIAQSGIGKVSAAYTLTHLLSMYDISLVINIGSAGGLQEDQKVGDVVIANRLQYHDLIFDYGNPSKYLEKFTFEPNPKNVEIMEKALDSLNIRHWTGLVVSGDQFVHDKTQYEYILERFPKAIGTDMESTAIAHVCHLSDIDYVIIRSLSDITIHQKSQDDFELYIRLASLSSAKACLLFLHKWKKEH